MAGDTQLGKTCEMICWLMFILGRGLTVTVTPSASAAPLVDTACVVVFGSQSTQAGSSADCLGSDF